MQDGNVYIYIHVKTCMLLLVALIGLGVNQDPKTCSNLIVASWAHNRQLTQNLSNL
jgi:hypothetical protein